MIITDVFREMFQHWVLANLWHSDRWWHNLPVASTASVFLVKHQEECWQIFSTNQVGLWSSSYILWLQNRTLRPLFKKLREMCPRTCLREFYSITIAPLHTRLFSEKQRIYHFIVIWHHLTSTSFQKWIGLNSFRDISFDVSTIFLN